MKNHPFATAGFVATVAIASVLVASRPAAATTPVTIDGYVRDSANKVVAGAVVVAWCGDLSHFGGSKLADTGGYYTIHTNSDDCPLGSTLTVTTDLNGDGISDGSAHAPTHTLTTVSIILGSYTTVAIPEYNWLTACTALLGGSAIFIFARRKTHRPGYTMSGD